MPILDPTENDARIRYWNRIYRTALLLLILLIFATIGYTAFEVNQNVRQTKALVISNQQSSVTARKNLTGYIKCLSLLRFDNPELLKTDVTRQQVSDALDKCAVRQ